MNDLKHFDMMAMIAPKTAGDRLVLLQELCAEIDNIRQHIDAITAAPTAEKSAA